MNNSLRGRPEALAALGTRIWFGTGMNSLMDILGPNKLKLLHLILIPDPTFLQASLNVLGQKLHLKGFEF